MEVSTTHVRRKWQFIFNIRYSNAIILTVNVKGGGVLFLVVKEWAIEFYSRPNSHRCLLRP
jgi:hypothetical protein